MSLAQRPSTFWRGSAQTLCLSEPGRMCLRNLLFGALMRTPLGFPKSLILGTDSFHSLFEFSIEPMSLAQGIHGPYRRIFCDVKMFAYIREYLLGPRQPASRCLALHACALSLWRPSLQGLGRGPRKDPQPTAAHWPPKRLQSHNMLPDLQRLP